MELEPNDLLLFARVADSGSFSRGAERMGLPKSSVSRRIAALETRLGERLFTRSPRRLALTDFGRSLLDHARRLAEEVEAVAAPGGAGGGLPRGPLGGRRGGWERPLRALLGPQGSASSGRGGGVRTTGQGTGTARSEE